MSKVLVSYVLHLNPGSPECDAVIALLREHSIQALQINQKLLTTEQITSYRERSKQLGRLLLKCFADNPHELDDIRWDTTDYLTKEEELSLTAPPG